MQKKKKNKKNSDSKKKLVITLLASLLIILMTLYISFKIFILNKYDVEKLENTSYDKFLKSYENKETLITKTKVVDNNDYLTYKNIKIKNNYKDYEKEELKTYGESIVYKKKDSSGNTIDFLQITISDESYIDWFSSKEKNFYTAIPKDGKEMPLVSNISDYLRENKINSDLDLFKLLSKTRNYKPNIFTSINKIKSNYGTHLIGSIIMSATDRFIVLSGDHIGYIQVMGNIEQVNIIKDNYTYCFLFSKKEDREILEVINSLIIE